MTLDFKPLVSVILPSFNHAAFIGEAVRSVLDQTFGDLELIVVDDGSSDETADIVASVRDSRLTFIRLAANRAVHPRNLALSHARGQYVAFQNSDDIWSQGKLAAQVEVMEGARRYAACFTAVELVNEKGAPSSGTWADQAFITADRPAASWLRHFFDVGNRLPMASAMVRRSDLIAAGAFRGSLVQLGDFDLWIRLAARGEFHIIPERLTKVRIVEGVNASWPSLRTTRRSQIELATVLERYTESPVIALFDDIFPELPKSLPLGAKKVALALRAWERGGAYALFADRTVARVMDDANERADAVAAHGTAFIHTFLARRSESEFVWHGARAHSYFSRPAKRFRVCLARCWSLVSG